MMDVNKIEPLLRGLKLNPTAPLSAIEACETFLGFELPLDYKEFLNSADGAEGFVGENYLILWPVEQLPGLNQAYHVEEYASGLLLFGSSGGGEAYAFDTRLPGLPIVQVPFVGMNLTEVWEVAPTFLGFLKKLAEASQDG